MIRRTEDDLTIRISVMACCALFLHIACASALVDVSTAKALVSDVRTICRTKQLNHQAVLLDNLGYLRKQDAFQDLETIAVREPKLLLSEIDRIAGDEVGEMIVFLALWKLPQEPFIEVLENYTSLAEAGRIPLHLLTRLQFPFRSPSEDTIRDNIHRPEIQGVLVRSKDLLQEQSEWAVSNYTQLIKKASESSGSQTTPALSNLPSETEGAKEVGSSSASARSEERPMNQAQPSQAAKQISTPSVLREEQGAAKTTSIEEGQPEDGKYRHGLLLLMGVITVVVCVGIWFVRRRAERLRRSRGLGI